MKRLISILILLALSICFVCSANAQYQKTKVAILDFQLQGDSHGTADMGNIVAEWLITALVKEGRFDVVERRLLEKILEEQKLALTGLVDARTASKLGKVLGVKVIISGSVMKYQSVLAVNARIIDVESGSIIAAESVKSSSAVGLENLVVQMAEKIIQAFPLEGYIVSRNGEKISIDLGRRAGVKETMQFIVFKEGNIVKHPKTGEVLDVEMIETGEIEIESVRDKMATAKIIKEESPNAIKYGHRVKSIFDESSAPIGQYAQPSSYRSSSPMPVTIAPLGPSAGLAEIDGMLLEAQNLKAAGDKKWKVPFRRAVSTLKQRYGRDRRSPQGNFYFAKVYLLEGKYARASQYLDRAIKADRQFLDAYVMNGDVCTLWAKSARRGSAKVAKKAVKNYQKAANTSQDNAFKSMMFLKMGNVYAELLRDDKRARKMWQKSVEVAPGSEAGTLAKGQIR